jgi:hypothetical protein
VEYPAEEYDGYPAEKDEKASEVEYPAEEYGHPAEEDEKAS